MGSQSNIILPDILRSIDSATFTGSFQRVGTPLPSGVRIVKFTNTSTVAVTVSWDGINANDILPSNSFLLLDVSANKENSTNFFEIQQRTQFYASGTAGTGNFYISCYYGNTI